VFWQRGNRAELRAENRRLQAALDQVTRQRDAALATARPGTTDPLGFLFIVTYGRSGSTLLMGMLNALPGFCIRGENQGVLYDLFQYQSKAVEARRKHRQNEPLTSQSPWYGIDGYPDDIGAARIRQLVIDTLLRPAPGTRVAGFKEIRWWMSKPVEYLDFIESLFPGARFLLNTRNLENVAKSGWYRQETDVITRLEQVEERLRKTVALRGDRGYHVHYDDYVSDPSTLRGMYEWLGEEYDPEQLARVLSVEHSFANRRNQARG
jgi:hypothetical protein